jgi:hypothetical protein
VLKAGRQVRDRTMQLASLWLILTLAVSIHAERPTYKLGTPYNQLLSVGRAGDCDRTWYDPEVFALPATSRGTPLRLLGQGNNPHACGTDGYDSLYAGTRDPVDGSWTTTSPTDCPAVVGFSKCGRPTWVWASPSVVKVGARYYMAFIGGNADFDKGKVYWAVSDDGTTWDVYDRNPPPGEPWFPLIAPKYFEDCFNLFGVAQLALAYEDGYFYIFMNYAHRLYYDDAPTQTWDSLAYRIRHDPSDEHGLSESREIYFDPDATGPAPGAWVAHSGRLAFTYDDLPAEPGEPLLGHFKSMWSMHNGGKEVVWDGSRERWIHAFAAYDSGTTRLHWQESRSLSANEWSERRDIDTSALNGPSGAFPNRTLQYPALWYGSVAGLPERMYIFVPLDSSTTSCHVPGTNTFRGLAIASAELIFVP